MTRAAARPVRLFGRFSAERSVDRMLLGIAGRIHAFVDGDRYRMTVALDTDEGWLEHYVLDDAGKIIRENGEMLRRRVTGHVLATVNRLTTGEATLLERHGKRWQAANAGAGD